MRLDKLLLSQGFGSRKECQFLIERGAVRIDGKICKSVKAHFDPIGLEFQVYETMYCYREFIYLALNKPVGYECSHQSEYHASVFELLPEMFLERGVQSVGRLDQDTTGLLLFTDDGQLIQSLTHPKKHVPKVYLVTTIDPITTEQMAQLEKGVQLRNEVGIFKATDVTKVDEHTLYLTVHQGVYHQVKRMIAAVGNKVDRLHREKIAQWVLPSTLAEGEWQYLDTADLAQLQIKAVTV